MSSSPSDRPSFVRGLIRTEPVALVLLVALAVVLFAITMTRVARRAPGAPPATTAVIGG